jgi:chondroitin sulfate synthase
MEARVVLLEVGNFGFEQVFNLSTMGGVTEEDYPGFHFQIVELGVNGKNGISGFSRGVGLSEGLAHCRDSDLVFILDVDIKFNLKALENVRRFTVESHSVYFPIVFSEFQDAGGYWRDFGYGIMAGYKKDIITAGGYNTNIKGWGIEDVDLYEKLLKSNITVFRSVEPNLIHKYHKVTCSSSLPRDQAMMCETSRANTFLSINSLYNLVLNSSIITP